MFNVPSQKDAAKCIIDEECITEGKEPAIVFKKKKASSKAADPDEKGAHIEGDYGFSAG